MSNATYSVAALAAALNVPRTTVNDWLTKYESFIEASAVGKRKVYSSQTLTVLQEVAKLRDMGKTGAEIEAALEGIVGVTPEIAPEKNAEAPAEKSSAATAENQAAPRESDTQNQLPAVKKIEENAMELAAFIAELRKEQLQSRKRSRFTAVMLFVVMTC
jgi:DNA-binding transcriptional MerR regulator